MAFALVFAYLFLVAQYEHRSAPVSVVLSAVVAVFGAVAPLVMLPFLDNNLYAQIGMVMLIGLASKNAVLIVEFAKVRRDAEAAVEAVRLRFRAVMMTAHLFLLGVLPLVFASGAGAASRTSIGFVVFGGMAAATGVGVVFLPCCATRSSGQPGGEGLGRRGRRRGPIRPDVGAVGIRGSNQGAERAVRWPVVRGSLPVAGVSPNISRNMRQLAAAGLDAETIHAQGGIQSALDSASQPPAPAAPASSLRPALDIGIEGGVIGGAGEPVRRPRVRHARLPRYPALTRKIARWRRFKARPATTP